MKIFIKILLFKILLILVLPIASFAQDPTSSKVSFKNIVSAKSTITENNSDSSVIVFFNIAGNISGMDADSLMVDMLNLDGVAYCKIFYNRICKMKIEKFITPESVRNILLLHNVDFDIETVETSDPQIISELSEKKLITPVSPIPIAIPSNEWIYPENFPVLIETGNPQLDEENFANAKQEWIKNNPEAFKKMTGVDHIGK